MLGKFASKKQTIKKGQGQRRKDRINQEQIMLSKQGLMDNPPPQKKKKMEF